MKAARTVGVLLLTLLAWVAVGAAHGPERAVEEQGVIQRGKRVLETQVSYDTLTGTPDGLARCRVELQIVKVRGVFSILP